MNNLEYTFIQLNIHKYKSDRYRSFTLNYFVRVIQFKKHLNKTSSTYS